MPKVENEEELLNSSQGIEKEGNSFRKRACNCIALLSFFVFAMGGVYYYQEYLLEKNDDSNSI
jgi:hypothetical protein